jgi:hypothetical protein
MRDSKEGKEGAKKAKKERRDGERTSIESRDVASRTSRP